MMKAFAVSRVSGGVLGRSVGYGFCLNGFAPLDPRKHITMNHNHHNMYLDIYEYGQYHDWVHIGSIPARTYEPLVLEVLASTLSQRFGTTITTEFLLSKRNRSWQKFLSKDVKTQLPFHELYPHLLGKLSQSIFVKESRFTWILEQKIRFDYTLSSYDAEPPQTVGEFIDRYNEDIEACVLYSNHGFAAEIDQAESALEKHELQQRLAQPGLQELNQLSEEHDNLINKVLAMLH